MDATIHLFTLSFYVFHLSQYIFGIKTMSFVFHREAVSLIISCLREIGPCREFEMRNYIFLRHNRTCVTCSNLTLSGSSENLQQLRQYLNELIAIGAVVYNSTNDQYDLPHVPLPIAPVLKRSRPDDRRSPSSSPSKKVRRRPTRSWTRAAI